MKKASAFMIILMAQIVSASNGKEAIGCKVHGLNSKDGHFRFKESSTFDTGSILNDNESKTLQIVFKTLTGVNRNFKLSIQKQVLPPMQFQPVATVGAKFAFNNPFEANSIYRRNDLTGLTELRGFGFTSEGSPTGLLKDILAQKQQVTTAGTSIDPYLMIGLIDAVKNEGHVRELLITPSGDIIDGLLVTCSPRL
jgi:hypothetical protein